MSDIFLFFNQSWIFSTDAYERPSIKIHGNPSSGNSADKCGQTDRQTDTTKLIDTSTTDFANAPKMVVVVVIAVISSTL